MRTLRIRCCAPPLTCCNGYGRATPTGGQLLMIYSFIRFAAALVCTSIPFVLANHLNHLSNLLSSAPSIYLAIILFAYKDYKDDVRTIY